jgi:hypothetical protein
MTSSLTIVTDSLVVLGTVQNLRREDWGHRDACLTDWMLEGDNHRTPFCFTIRYLAYNRRTAVYGGACP